jgi:hypothetical protein
VGFVTASNAAEPEGFDSVERARLKDRLLYLVAELEGILAFIEGRYEPEPGDPAVWLYHVWSSLPEESSREVLRRWRQVFADELQVVQLARNSVAHARYISDDSLRNAVAGAERLVSIAKSSVSAYTEDESDIGQPR